MKKFVTFLLTMSLVGCLVGCGSTTKPDTAATSIELTDTVEVVEEVEEIEVDTVDTGYTVPADVDPAEYYNSVLHPDLDASDDLNVLDGGMPFSYLSDGIFWKSDKTYSMKLNGVEFTLPISYSDFADKIDWTDIVFYSVNEDELLPGESKSVDFYLGDARVSATVMNRTEDNAKAEECTITRINVVGYPWMGDDDKFYVETSLGVTFGTDNADVLKACEDFGLYTLATEEELQKNYYNFWEDAPNYRMIGGWAFGLDEGKLYQITMEYCGD